MRSSRNSSKINNCMGQRNMCMQMTTNFKRINSSWNQNQLKTRRHLKEVAKKRKNKYKYKLIIINNNVKNWRFNSLNLKKNTIY